MNRVMKFLVVGVVLFVFDSFAMKNSSSSSEIEEDEKPKGFLPRNYGFSGLEEVEACLKRSLKEKKKRKKKTEKNKREKKLPGNLEDWETSDQKNN